jgi:hypothetical protein
MATKKIYKTRILLINADGMDKEQRIAVKAKYRNSHNLQVVFDGEYEFLHTDEFNMSYALGLCNRGIVIYAKMHGFVIPDNIYTRRGISDKVNFLIKLVSAESVEIDEEDTINEVLVTEPSKTPSKEDFVTLIDDESSKEDKVPEIVSTDSDEDETKGKKHLIPDIEKKVIIKPVDVTKVLVPKDLNCPHCGAVARTEKSYIKNHGDNCVRKLETK